jgi:FtsH-binding integral membrane protein
MSPTIRYFAWLYFRAFIWVGLITFALYRSTRNKKVSRAFAAAHAVALGIGILTDVFLWNIAPKSWLVIDVLQWVFMAPIAIFTVISLYIASWEKDVHAQDAFMTILPIIAWGLMVIYGWQSMWDCHVLGAWFVSAASGAVDLFALNGTSWAKRHSYRTRLIGYATVVMTVYLLLPQTE